MKKFLPALFVFLTTAVLPTLALACTSMMVTPEATADNSAIVTYVSDSHELYGELYHYPEADYREGSSLAIHDWDSGKFLGYIQQVPHTYRVVGNMNEHQLVIAETTFGGREELENPQGGIDYGSLIYVTLQRAKTAREAIKIIDELATKYGYFSSGESFSIADKNEVWYMELIGKGPGSKGIVWVARKVPAGYMSAHANQARITTFPLKDPDTLYSKDVISFAKEKGYFKGRDRDFSFADAYAPLDFSALRFCEARVYQIFHRANPDEKLSLEYVLGNPKAPRLPLWIKPARKINVTEAFSLMRDHYENSPMDMHGGIGAGPFDLPYRWRPMTWKYNNKEYFHERATSTQQTGFSFISQSRANLPDVIGGLLWFGVDDTYGTVYVPMYTAINYAPKAYAVGTADFKHFSWDSAFWLFNAVTNFSYLRYSDMIKDIQSAQAQLEGAFLAQQHTIEEAAQKKLADSEYEAREFLTAYSAKSAEKVMARWSKLFQELIMKYMDGNVRDETGTPTHPRYPDSWYKAIIDEAPEKYLVK